MANHSATKKSVRKTAARNERNRYQGKTTRNAIRDFKVIDTKATALEGLPNWLQRLINWLKEELYIEIKQPT